MRVYISSTFEDLREHRLAATQVLRQLGHEVVAMEDYVAEGSVPLGKVLPDVEAADVVVEIVAWRYGYVPQLGPTVPGATAGKTSITEYEYRKAVETKKPVLAFLLDERAPWPAHLIDGVRQPRKATAVSAFRAELQRNRLVSFFTTPDSLAARVSAAVGAVGMQAEVKRQLIAPWSAAALASFTMPVPMNESLLAPILNLVSQPALAVAAAVDLSTTWWSTRLYLLAAVGQKLGDLRRIVFLDKKKGHERFVGIVSANAVRSALRRIHPEAERFEKEVLSGAPGSDVRQTARQYLETEWHRILKATPGGEEKIALTVNDPNLRLWFGESLFETPVRIDDVESASPVDLLRILDYPNDFVPVVTLRASAGHPVQLVNKRDLTERLARNAIVEMLDRLGVR
jgi:hypothetical protein